MPWLAVLISAFIVGTCRIIMVPTTLGLTRHAVVVYIHVVSVGPILPVGVTNCFPLTHLGGLSFGVSVTLVILRVLIFMVACWSFWFKLAMVAVKSAMVFLEVFIVSLSDTAAVAKLIIASCVSSPVSWRLFVSCYPANLVEFFASFCFYAIPPGIVPGILPRFCWRIPYRPICHSHCEIVRYCTQ